MISISSAKLLAKQLAKRMGVPRSRRGSVLVLIVGVLAMIALLVLVYSTLGQADRRGAASLTAQIRLSDQASSARDYFARTIADSTFNYVYQRNVLGRDTLLRTAADYPFTDPELFSTSRNVANANVADFAQRRFVPTGQMQGAWKNPGSVSAADVTDPRMGAGLPWLSSSEPTWVKPYLFAQTPSFTTTNRPSDDFRDWAHISNFAPSGNFVSLVMLRQNADEPGSGYDVKSGVGPERFTNQLTLRDGGTPTRLSGTASLGTAPKPKRIDGAQADLNRPSDWTNNQVGVLGLVETDANLQKPGLPGYLWNEWVDTDGDGNPDVRPFEFVDVSNPDAPQTVIPLDPGYRWVFAARAIDLSGRVNVNTAWQSAAYTGAGAPALVDPMAMAPTLRAPLGMNPSEINLKGLLESKWLYDYAGGGSQSTYSTLTNSDNAPDYRQNFTNVADAATIGGSAFSSLIYARLTGTVPPRGRQFWPGQLPESTGYSGPTVQLNVADIIAPANLSSNPARRDLMLRAGLASVYANARDPEGAVIVPELVVSTANSANPRYAPRLHSQSSFALADLLELLTYNGANDPTTTSRLESVLDGRGDADGSGNTPDFPNVGPMRSNRGKTSEVTPRNLTIAGAQRAQEALTQAFVDIRSRLTTLSGARPLLGRSFNSSSAPGLAQIGEADLRRDVNDIVGRLAATRPIEFGLNANDWARFRAVQYDAVNALLDGYAAALLPASSLRNDPNNPSDTGVKTPWAADLLDSARDADATKLQPLNFGPTRVPTEGRPRDLATNLSDTNGTEMTRFSTTQLALRRAAHMALNLWAARDIDMGGQYNITLQDNNLTRPVGPSDEIVGATLIFDGKQLSQNLPNQSGTVLTTLNADGTLMFPWANEGNAARGREVTSQTTVGSTGAGTMQGYQRAALLNLDAGKYSRINGTIIPGRENVLDRLDSRDLSEASVGRPINIFGVKPQPFVTATTAYVAYTDTPLAKGGDKDWEVDPNTGDLADKPITIKGDVSGVSGVNNRDFLFQVIVFTLTNPFDTDLNLSSELAPGTANDFTRDYKYYLEFAGRKYPLVQHDDSGSNARAFILHARQSIDFYVLADDPMRIETRMRQAATRAADVPTDIVQHWLDAQVVHTGELNNARVGNQYFRLWPMSADGARETLNPASDLALLAEQRSDSSTLNPPLVSSDEQKDADRQVLLWRAFKDSKETDTTGVQSAEAQGGGQNIQSNDILIDRLRDPAPYSRKPTLAVQLEKDGQNDVISTQGGPEGQGGVDPVDNTGYSIVVYAAIRRPGDKVAVAPGVVPSYCIENKSSLARAKGYEKSRNYADIVDDETRADNIKPNRSMFTHPAGAIPIGAQTLASMLTRQYTGTTSDQYKRLMDTNPDKAGPDTSDWLRVGPDTFAVGNRPRFRDRAPVWPLWKRTKDVWNAGAPSYVPPMRLIDTLRPLAIGPVHDPLRTITDGRELATGRTITPNSTDLSQPLHRDVQWTTLAEALALSVDADSAATSDDVDYFAGDRDFGSLDRGHLPLYRFTPFNDLNGDGIFTQVSNATDRDPPVGAGIPFAMDVINQFRTLAAGTTQTMVTGVVNLNTASQSVLRATPMGFLDIDELMQSMNVIAEDSTGTAATKPFFIPAQKSELADLGSLLEAYRDKTIVYRPTNDDFLDMRDVTTNAAFADNTGDDNGRRTTTGIAALREAPGFQSVGEVLAVRSIKQAAGTSRPITGFDFLGRGADKRTDTSLTYDLSPSGYTLKTDLSRGQAANTPKPVLTPFMQLLNPADAADPRMDPSAARGTYESQLTLAGALLNSVSVRSDVFAVWFTMDGYRRADTENLTVDDPMVPSVRKRYVMVVDRSNVTQKGQQPRILLFTDLPVE
ncbi:hypothetical protein BH11PLA1_BH11PLA1_11540 [soil metagenome]